MPWKCQISDKSFFFFLIFSFAVDAATLFAGLYNEIESIFHIFRCVWSYWDVAGTYGHMRDFISSWNTLYSVPAAALFPAWLCGTLHFLYIPIGINVTGLLSECLGPATCSHLRILLPRRYLDNYFVSSSPEFGDILSCCRLIRPLTSKGASSKRRCS